MNYELLYSVDSPEDLKKLPNDKIAEFNSEVRRFLIEKVGRQGGHLASNLGTVELSVALHRVFDSPKDHIIFDVGHQAYVHKLITGRRDDFDNLRVPGGLSGFTSMRESEHDAFGAGHSSTSISAALGYAEADKLAGRDNYTIAVIGDGSYTGGMVHEAINNCREDLRLVVVINENGMSISHTRGAFASYLSRVRASRGYRGMKRGTVNFLSRIPVIGRGVKAAISFVKSVLKKLFFDSNYFEDLGFYYIGPIDGNDYDRVERALEEAKDIGKCVFLHLITKKGKGYSEAEESPESFHSLSQSSGSAESYHTVFADELISLAKEDGDVVSVTAAMGVGTGLSEFEKVYPKRYFDVGIAEEHALTFSAGLAAAGLKPYTAIYSTFLQRGYDNVIHDICLQGLPVRIFIDRAGISVKDGATHHGIFDVAFLSHVPSIELYAPLGMDSLRSVMRKSLYSSSPFAVRYANSGVSESVSLWLKRAKREGNILFDFDKSNPPKKIIVTYGNETERVLFAVKILSDLGERVGVVVIERIKPYSEAVDFLLEVIGEDSHILYAEEGIKNGGAAMITRDMLFERGISASARIDIAAIDDTFLIPDEIVDVYDYAGLSGERLASYFIRSGGVLE